VHPFRGPQLGQLRGDDHGVHGLGDLHERYLAAERDQRQAARPGRVHQRVRQPAVPPPQLHGQPAHPGQGQLGHVRGEQARIAGQRDAGAQHQLTAVQQARHVGHLHRVHPAHTAPQPVITRQDFRPAAADGVQFEHVSQCRQHGHLPA